MRQSVLYFLGTRFGLVTIFSGSGCGVCDLGCSLSSRKATPFLPAGFRGARETAVLGHRRRCGGPPLHPVCAESWGLRRTLGPLSPRRTCVLPAPVSSLTASSPLPHVAGRGAWGWAPTAGTRAAVSCVFNPVTGHLSSPSLGQRPPHWPSVNAPILHHDFR